MALDLQRVAQRVEAQDLRGAAGRLGQPEQHQDGRGLAGAVGPEEAEHLALVDVQVKRADGELPLVAVAGGVALLEAPRPDDHRSAGHGHRLP